MQSLIVIIIIKQKGNPRKTKKLELRTKLQSNNDRQTTTGEQRYKYTDKQAKQGNKGAWLIRNTWGD